MRICEESKVRLLCWHGPKNHWFYMVLISVESITASWQTGQQFSSLGLTLPRCSFLHGGLHTFAGSNQMSQIMGLIQSKLCRAGRGEKSCFWFFSALCRCSKCQACLHPQLTPLEFHKPFGGEAEREPRHPDSRFYRSTNKSSSIRKTHFPALCLAEDCYMLWGWCRNSQEGRPVFVFLLFLKTKQDFYFQK